MKNIKNNNILNNILKLMWGILKLKVGNFETGSNLSPCDPFVSNQQLEPQGFIFKTYIFNCTEKKLHHYIISDIYNFTKIICTPISFKRYNFIKKIYAPLPTIPMGIVGMGA